MKRYQVTERVARIGHGAVIGLSDAQAVVRKHNLQATQEAGVFTATAPLEFKRGEEIGLHGDLDKTLASVLSPVGGEEPQAATKPAKKKG